MKTRTVTIRVRCWGKAPKRFGPNAYKFSSAVRGILKRNDWTLLGSGRNYDYLAPPQGQHGKDVIVSASIPMDAEIERIAFALHEKREPVTQEIDGWIVTYHPASPFTMVQVDLFNKGRQIGQPQLSVTPAWFQIGSHGSWYVHLDWKDGDNEPPHWHKFEGNIIPNVIASLQSDLGFDVVDQDESIADLEPSTPTEELLREGVVQQELVNSYERNLEARRRCIEHYGVSCAVCGFNFAERYGAIGEGFIHVHHLTPLSDIRGDYEIDPIRDLRPVCPNCHAMLHRRSPPFSLIELQTLLKKHMR